MKLSFVMGTQIGIEAQIRELKQRKGETFIAYVTEVEQITLSEKR